MNATPIVRRPLVGVAISVAAGLFFHNNYGGSPLLLLGLSAVLLSLCCWMIFRRNTAGLLYLCCATLASAYSAIESLPSAATNTFMVAEHRYSELDIQGTIADDPVTYESNSTVSFLLKAQLLLNENQHLPINTLVRVYAKAGSDTIQFGEQWRFCGRLTRYKKPRGGAEGSFRVTDAKGWKIKEASPSLLGYCYALRRDAAAILRSGVEPFLEQTRLIHAMLLGYRQAIPSDLYLLFTRTGTLHIFAISGQHAVMLAAIFIAGLKLIGIPRPRWGLLLIPSLFLYIFTTGLQPSALRALAMATIFFIAPFVKRRPDIPSSMAVAALLILMMNPANINDPGFLLSFVIVSGL
ncbi:MAG: ComEC family competence protein, partial [Kiritimatiellaceae bacterium]|nr:ComEC family competence protein [Kiritimatiellaceae bacterium]